MGDRKKPKCIMGVNQFLEYAFGGKEEAIGMSEYENAIDVQGITFSERFENKVTSGPTGGLQSLYEWEKTPNVEPFATITEDMLCIVGKNANRFIGECSKWMKELGPLDARNWLRMDKDTKKRLFNKIQAECNFPPEAERIVVAHAVELQCMMLFRSWRYRLKEDHFAGKTHISEKNRSNRLSQNIKPSNGSKSTARIYHDEIMPLYTLAKDSTQDPTKEQTIEIPHKDGKWDLEGEVKYEEFKKLHEDQI
ncbi:hypothetical protein Cgig2_029573 [Carnegiea gigantea]|uniref:Uncharacterized protein n=1 Tax=Carnegiea gigantea TaxID=171969 RepID=A0A9Q1GU88_9CARY|nr:hypothetical protein Cgig2_029573 [Carnegiea gigantea]